ncbi:MAG: outer membrane protein assembly factor BamA [Cytophagales bacterium]|nr:MAG: outer membrane protein assembly factor BamA [Cytophagales bacterium]TAF62102.1 MAG: outer membrane protein assembly factor BamA [Cytophagales bacterium]
MPTIVFRTLLITFLSCWMVSAHAQLGINRKKTYTTGDAIDYAAPKQYEIGGVKVVGAAFADPNTLISMTDLRVGRKINIPGDEISNAIRLLWKQGLLGDVQIAVEKFEGEKVFLLMTIQERPRLSRFVFEGIRRGQADALTEKIKLIRGKIVTDVMLKNTESTIKKHFVDKGFKNTKVEIIQKKDTLLNNSTLLTISVDRGNRVKIEEIAVTGITQFKEGKVLRKMKKTKATAPWRIFTPSRFLAKEYEKDKERVIEFYNKNGYRDAAITYDTVYDVSDNRMSIKMTLHEGNRYYFRNITWEGNYLYPDSALQSVLGIKRGDPYNPTELQKRLNYNPSGLDVSAMYMDRGHLFFGVDPVEVRIENDSVDIEMRIFEGDQASINRVSLAGNTTTSDHVVMREIRTMPGQKFNRSLLVRSQRELMNLGYFDPEGLNALPKPNMSDGTVDIGYKVVERSNNQIELSGGWGGFLGFVGTLGLNLGNFSARKLLKFKEWQPLPQGDGQRMSLRLQANGRAFQTYSATFSEPWLGGKKPTFFSVNLQHSVQRSFNTQRTQATGSFQVTSASLSIGKRLTFPDDYFAVNYTLSYLRYNLDNFGNLGFRDITTGKFNNFVFNTTFSRNSIDNPIYPREGSNISLSVNLSPPYSMLGREVEGKPLEQQFQWIEYHKWMFDNWWYLKLVQNFVLMTRMHFGYIGTYTPRTEVTPFERFIVGGDGLSFGNMVLGQDIVGLRGYENNSIVPSINAQSKNEGGTIFNKMVIELRYPLTMSQATSIYVLAFAEGGNNWAAFKDFNPFDIKRSAGVGARIFMPAFGMLGVDWAYGFDALPGTTRASGSQFHFTIGQMIR